MYKFSSAEKRGDAGEAEGAGPVIGVWRRMGLRRADSGAAGAGEVGEIAGEIGVYRSLTP